MLAMKLVFPFFNSKQKKERTKMKNNTRLERSTPGYKTDFLPWDSETIKYFKFSKLDVDELNCKKSIIISITTFRLV
jgi:hypothetical protein